MSGTIVLMAKNKKSKIKWILAIFIIVALVTITSLLLWQNSNKRSIKIDDAEYKKENMALNNEILGRAVDARNPDICDELEGNVYIGNPGNLNEPILISEESAEQRCNTVVKWHQSRD